MGYFRKKLSTMLVTSVLLMTGLSSAYAENLANERISLSDVTFETCQESVAFEGSVHYIENATIDNDGGYHVKIQWNYANAKGTGLTSGVQYVLIAKDNLMFNLKAGETRSGTFSAHAIAQGPQAPDFLIHGTFHVTIDSDGNIISEVTQLKASCYES